MKRLLNILSLWKWEIGLLVFVLAITVAIVTMNSIPSRAAADTAAADERLSDTYAAIIETAPATEAESVVADVWTPDENDVKAIAQTMYAECRGVGSKTEQAAVAWCILNRVDSTDPYFPDNIIDVVAQPYQFAYSADSPVLPELEELARDVITRWHSEKNGDADIGRVLPPEYLYFIGDGEHNHFSAEWQSGEYWDWEAYSPYDS